LKFSIFHRNNKSEPIQKTEKSASSWAPKVAWGIAGLMVVIMVVVIVLTFTGVSISSLFNSGLSTGSNEPISSLPSIATPQVFDSISRQAKLNTNLPQGYRTSPVSYSVEKGDSLFSIAKQYNIKPETLLWANQQSLGEDSGMLSIGINLNVPPVDGVLYQWQDGDTLENVAAKFHAKVQDILLWPGNNLDMTNPVIQPDQFIMIPGGYREIQPWVIPVAAGTKSGVNVKISGPGSCSPTGGSFGSGSFIWPTQHQGQITGNDYSSYHLGIDAMCYAGEPIYASDSGVVIYSGPISGGYGNLVAIDHRNGYLSLYGHLSGFNVICGQNVTRGQTIGFCGSVGNSTGPHLHFEIRLGTGFVNPHSVLQ